MALDGPPRTASSGINLACSGGQLQHRSIAHARRSLNYIHIPFNAAQPEPRVLDEFLAAIANKANQPAYVHCGSANRVGAVWLAKRVLQDGWTIEKATEEAKLIGLRSEPLEKFALSYIAANKK